MKLTSIIQAASFASFFRRPAPKPMTVSQEGIQARAIRHLIKHRHIDAWTVTMMGTTDAHKMFTRMRRMQLLYPADDANGHRLLPNAKGQACYRRHYWTGKYPPGWDKPTMERRKAVRGGKA